MGFRCGIVGLPNVGKSTLFNALTSAGAAVANYPFCTIEANVGMVVVDDARLAEIDRFVSTRKIIPTTMEFVDIAGLVKGASQGEGLGNQFLARIAELEAVAHVVRCFEDPGVVHVDGCVDPIRDIDVIQTELLLRDTAHLEKWLARNEKAAKSGDVKLLENVQRARTLLKIMNQGKPARSHPAEDGDQERALLNLVTDKPTLYVANVSEAELPDGNAHSEAVRKRADAEGAQRVVVCGKLEAEIAQLDPVERGAFLESAGLKEPGLARLVRAGYELLGLRTFFTAGEKEIRAWTIPAGATAPQAAGKIHSDFERGFISAEVIGFQDFIASGGEQGAKAKGLMRREGKEYIVQDGDIILFRFNV